MDGWMVCEVGSGGGGGGGGGVVCEWKGLLEVLDR